MERAVELAWKCPRAESAFAVGAVIVDAEGQELATGYSRETDDKVHAEESALIKLGNDPRLSGATVYSTLEPCSQRASRPKPCMQLILEAGIPRVVIAWREPSLFVENCVGVEELQAAGVEVVELPEMASAALAPNAHLDIAS
jgi:diaminohydroxyphosphoribosylaminopyrimidine deaminase/5-amino-6-(5-phosphoribosylamino)uracil reductase